MTDLGRFYVVEFAEGVSPMRKHAYMDDWIAHAGVVRVVDLAAIDQETLDVVLMAPPTPEEVPAKVRGKKSVVQQELPAS